MKTRAIAKPNQKKVDAANKQHIKSLRVAKKQLEQQLKEK